MSEDPCHHNREGLQAPQGVLLEGFACPRFTFAWVDSFRDTWILKKKIRVTCALYPDGYICKDYSVNAGSSSWEGDKESRPAQALMVVTSLHKFQRSVLESYSGIRH